MGGLGVTVGGLGVAVGGLGVAVGGLGVAVGGAGVAVGGAGVAVGGAGVAVGGAGVAVGGLGFGVRVAVGRGVAVCCGVAVGTWALWSALLTFTMGEQRKSLYALFCLKNARPHTM